MLNAIIAISRALVIWLVQAGVTAVLYTLVDKVLNKIQDIVRDYYGIDDNSAGAIFANALLDAAAFIGVGAAVVAKKIPLNVAKRMGLDVARPAKLAVSKAAAVKIAAKDKVADGKGFKEYIDTGLKVVGIPAAFIWLTSAVANIVEPGIYKPEQTNAVYRSLGIPFQYPTDTGGLSPGTFSPAEFSDYYLGLVAAGAVSISDPFKQQNLPFSEQALADLVQGVYGQQNAQGKSTTVTKLKPAIAPYIRLANGRAPDVSTSGVASGSSASASGGVATISQGAQVFTGIVSQGVVGSATPFNARPDDLIESVTELREAAQNNLAAYLAALPGKIVYEVKIVPSVVTKDGFKQTGLTQKIPNGTNTDGTAKYKTVTNKFAVIAIYAVTDKGTRTKLTQITLGPTNSAKLAVAQADLRALESSLPSLVTETNIKNVENIAAPVAEEKKVVSGVPSGVYEQNGRYYRVFSSGEVKETDAPTRGGVGSTSVNLAAYVSGSEATSKPNTGGTSPAPSTGTAVSSPVPVATKPGSSATTLYEWYTAQGLSLPSVSERSAVYESLGLGPKSYYTGTAEQNVRLLAALKAK